MSILGRKKRSPLQGGSKNEPFSISGRIGSKAPEDLAAGAPRIAGTPTGAERLAARPTGRYFDVLAPVLEASRQQSSSYVAGWSLAEFRRPAPGSLCRYFRHRSMREPGKHAGQARALRPEHPLAFGRLPRALAACPRRAGRGCAALESNRPLGKGAHHAARAAGARHPRALRPQGAALQRLRGKPGAVSPRVFHAHGSPDCREQPPKSGAANAACPRQRLGKLSRAYLTIFRTAS